jgi:Pin2-interacting protein X1
MPPFYHFSYHKFTRGKDLSNYSDKDLACILGVTKSSDIPDYRSMKGKKNDKGTLIRKVDNSYGVMTVNGGDINNYFTKKKQKTVDDAPKENHAEFHCEKEPVGLELGNGVYVGKIEVKKKQKYKNVECLDTQGKEVDRPETKGNELTLNGDSTDGLNCKKKKRKLEQESRGGKHLPKKDERSDEDTDTVQYTDKDMCHFEEKGNCIIQEHKRERKKKRKENPDIDGKEIGQETDGNAVNDISTKYLNYRKKKRKLEQEVREHFLKEEDTMKQNGRKSAEESCSDKDIYVCEVEDTKIKSKRKESGTESQDVLGKEDEADRNEMTLLNGDSVIGFRYNKKGKKLKQEVEEIIIEQGKRVNDNFDSSAHIICYGSRKKCEKNSLQENEEFLDYQASVPAGGMPLHKNDLSGKLKSSKNSVDRGTEEADHSKMKGNETVEEETRKHKMKKKKKRKHSKDGTTYEFQEHKLVQCNVEETHNGNCDRKNCDELSVIGETIVLVKCKNGVGKEKRRKVKILNHSKSELECEKGERIQEQDDTEVSEQKSETYKQNDKTQNAEGLKEARNTHKLKQDVCNPHVHNSADAIIRNADLESRDVSIRKMRPSVFAQLIDPSLITFRGSNLCKIPGYGNY